MTNDLLKFVERTLSLLEQVWKPSKYDHSKKVTKEEVQPLRDLFEDEQKALAGKIKVVITNRNKQFEQWRSMDDGEKKEVFYKLNILPLNVQLNTLVRIEHLRVLGMQIITLRDFAYGVNYLLTAMDTPLSEDRKAVRRFVENLDTFSQNHII